MHCRLEKGVESLHQGLSLDFLRETFLEIVTTPHMLMPIVLVALTLVLSLGLLSSALSYIHLMFGGFVVCWQRLIGITVGLWTESQLSEFGILRRSALAEADGDGTFTAHEAVTTMTARSHGLYWLFVPGFSIILKMCAYMGEAPLYLVGDKVQEGDPEPECKLKQLWQVRA